MARAVGARLRQWRESRGMTQRELADAVGVTPQAVSRWELDEPAKPVHVAALDRALGADGAILDLYGLTPPEVLADMHTALAELAETLGVLDQRVARLERGRDDSGELARRRRR